MKEILFKSIIVILVVSAFSCGKKNEDSWSVNSPDGSIIANVQINQESRLVYEVLKIRNGSETTIIEPSPLGIIREDQDFDALKFISVSEVKEIDEEYSLSSGKRLLNHNRCNEVTFRFQNANDAKIDLVFRAYDEGIAFKYVFPEVNTNEYVVLRELTGFDLPEGKAFMQPYDSITPYAPAYERNYEGPFPVGVESPSETGWCFPALFETNDHWVLLTEANLKRNFYGSHLHPKAENGLYTIVPPQEEEAFGYGNARAASTLPWDMPWRVIIVSDQLAGIVESNLVFHVSDPSIIDDPSWIRPGRASWGWWSGYLKERSTDTPEKLRNFIDFAQTMGWEYSLVDAGWDTRKGLNIEELADYAEKRNVKLLLWYNSGGPINRVNAGPRDKMFEPEIRRAEMKRISEMGIRGVKIDFFASDKQDFMKLYLDILKDAADYGLLVNFHGCTVPRGWARTYPNLISYESVKGSEGYIYHADFEQNAPMHNSILPFTRNVVGSMDYTPVAFSVQQVPHRTSYGHELALSVVFESGIQHFPDTPEMYGSQPAEVQGFLKSIPAAWDDTRFVTGYPGKEVVIARKKGDHWFVGGINAEENGKNVELTFDFLDEGVEYVATLIADGETNTSFAIDQLSVGKHSDESVRMAPIGGFVMKITKR